MITVPEERKKFEEQAEKDWETILLRRAEELVPGKMELNHVNTTEDLSAKTADKATSKKCPGLWLAHSMIFLSAVTYDFFEETWRLYDSLMSQIIVFRWRTNLENYFEEQTWKTTFLFVSFNLDMHCFNIWLYILGANYVFY